MTYKHEQMRLIYDSIENGNFKQAIKYIDEYGFYDIYDAYENYLMGICATEYQVMKAKIKLFKAIMHSTHLEIKYTGD